MQKAIKTLSFHLKKEDEVAGDKSKRGNKSQWTSKVRLLKNKTNFVLGFSPKLFRFGITNFIR